VSEAAGAVASVASKTVAAAKGPLHMLRGTGEEEKLLKNAKTEYSEEAEEIAGYTAIETLADTVGDRETAKVARGIRREGGADAALPRAADPAAYEGRCEGRDSGFGAQRRAWS
jgi:ferritin-like metal-binding protein YciE